MRLSKVSWGYISFATGQTLCNCSVAYKYVHFGGEFADDIRDPWIHPPVKQHSKLRCKWVDFLVLWCYVCLPEGLYYPQTIVKTLWHLGICNPIICLSTIQTSMQVSIESRVCLLVEGGQMVFCEQWPAVCSCSFCRGLQQRQYKDGYKPTIMECHMCFWTQERYHMNRTTWIVPSRIQVHTLQVLYIVQYLQVL